MGVIYKNLPELNLTTDETRDFVWDLSPRLTSGVTVSSASGTLTIPDGTSAALATTPTNTTTRATLRVTAAELTTAGTYYLDALATLSNGEIYDGRWELNVIVR